MNRPQDAVKSIQETSHRIVETTRGLSDDILRWKPAEGAWSIQEILCHVEESVTYWLHELEQVAGKPGTLWGRGLQDEMRLAAVAQAPQRAIPDVLAGIERAARQAGVVLGRLSDKDLSVESPSRNPRLGTKPAAFIVDHMLVEHVEKHLGQIQRNLAQFGALKPQGEKQNQAGGGTV